MLNYKRFNTSENFFSGGDPPQIQHYITLPPKMHDMYDDMYQTQRTTTIVVLVIHFVFLFGSLILGCILYSRYKHRAVKRGHIVSSSTGVQSFGVSGM